MCRFVNIRDLIEDLEGSVVHIPKLAVHPSWRKRGIGSALLSSTEAIAKLQNVKMLVTFVHEENSSGINWLCKRGFTGHNVHAGRSPDGRDSYSFVKVLE